MRFTFSGTPSGELTGFECRKATSIPLKSKEFSDGKIETEDFGIIIIKRTTGTTATYQMTDNQIKKLTAFLGFNTNTAAQPPTSSQTTGTKK
jgi:hypothetical protein